MARDAQAEQIAWEISVMIQGHIGGGLRASPDDPWNDAMLATRDSVNTRRTQPSGVAAQWRQEHPA
jgi:hypothetical protein